MRKFSARNVRFVIWSACILGMIGWIWGQSLLPAEASGAESGRVSAFLASLLGEDSALFLWLGPRIRKLAHFTEYFVLGIPVGLLLWNRRAMLRLPMLPAMFGGTTVAIADEFFFQWLTPGRAPLWTDVLIDSCGYVGAVALLALGYGLGQAKEKNKT